MLLVELHIVRLGYLQVACDVFAINQLLYSSKMRSLKGSQFDCGVDSILLSDRPDEVIHVRL